MNNIIIAPSILSADFANLGREIEKIDQAGADWIHIDVMDGRFVPNLTIGPSVIKALRKYTDKLFDVHLMIEEPLQYIEEFVAAGANILTVHIESSKHIDKVLRMIKDFKLLAGIALNPATPVCLIKDIVDIVDLILIMAVNPGFGGQKFINYSLKKIQEVGDIIGDKKIYIEVDGGINADNVELVVSSGCNVVVAGSFIFSSHQYKKQIEKLRIR